MSLPANDIVEALDDVNNSTDVTGLLESLTGLVQNVVSFLPTLLAQSQENNRALAHICSFTQASTGKNYCSTASSVMVPSMLGMVVAVTVVVLVNMVDHVP
ncbi:hypothetical protein HO173_006540 [Letharia columbiana]|uniref:Uncharacterized protein n=1 Tax=Letharia columbiana TaxID=112416 RepID=A0A8H6FV30_9LECA|nr:uncharacterized protein HO173_006540 [Letharia columbiana]KAF6235344.1 hypothetical protein HO173_006540 [Letharia columbiana]